ACPQCPVGCSKIMAVKSGPFSGAETDGPEYETIYAFGPALDNDSMESIIYADKACDQLGMDTISCGVTLAWAMECYERGILSRGEVDGLDLRFGRANVIPEILRKMAAREGIGGLLADGVREAARKVGRGSEKFAMHTKGMELGGYDPRGIKGQALVVACGPRGGCHHAGGYVIAQELTSGQYDRMSTAGKGELVQKARDFRMVMDSALYCAFLGVAFGLDVASRLIGTATGIPYTPGDLSVAAQRGSVMERLFNVREGLRREDDTLPYRLLAEPLREGPSAGGKLKSELDNMVTDLYQASGWDVDTGIPTRSTLEKLGIKDMDGLTDYIRKD
ncbi:MAG: aldehyde ferredoxin oxidoreductase C-terminal domain-containing protein, partial [Desulfocucumaceae bacterium]